ncbi:MAG: hypothetical protein A2Y39_07115 [Candidatus Delongbacteria bacterium GWF2_40_14]|nr:MAG: hypothetical protein A2Y39_07115 [Candidatus Delongbacteria bacterium GWF2_40_14]
MKVFLQMFKHSYNMIPKISLSLLIMMVSITIYKLCFLGADISLFSDNNLTIAQIVFRVIFTIFLIVAYFRTFVIISGPSVSILQMLPEIRKKVVKFAGLNLGLIFIWAVLILGHNDFQILLSFIFSSLWMLSTIITISSFRVPVYRSNKYWFLKLIFALFSFVVPIMYIKGTPKHPIMYYTILSVFFIVIIYQMFNFVSNYINNRFKDDFKKTGFVVKINSFQAYFDDAIVKELNSLIYRIKSDPKNKYIKLFQFSLFEPTPTVLVLIFYAFIVFALLSLQGKLGIIYFVSLLLYFLLISALNYSRIYRKRNKIEHLYLVSKLSRNKFELTVLSTVFRQVIIGFACSVPIFTLGLVIYSKYFVTAELLLISSLILSYYIAELLIIFILWTFMIKGRDFDTIKQARVMSN